MYGNDVDHPVSVDRSMQLDLEPRSEGVVDLEVCQQIRESGVPLGQLTAQPRTLGRRSAEVAEEIASK